MLPRGGGACRVSLDSTQSFLDSGYSGYHSAAADGAATVQSSWFTCTPAGSPLSIDALGFDAFGPAPVLDFHQVRVGLSCFFAWLFVNDRLTLQNLPSSVSL